MDEQSKGAMGGTHAAGGSAGAEAKDVAREAVETGKERARSFLDEQKGHLADEVSGFAAALRDSARHQGGNGHGSTILAERTATGMERLARSLREQDLQGILRECEGFAHRSPGVFLGGAVTAGFLLARFFKSSSERRARESYPGEGRGMRPSFGAGTSASASGLGTPGGMGTPGMGSSGSRGTPGEGRGI